MTEAARAEGVRGDGFGRAWLWAMLLALAAHSAFLIALRSVRVPERVELTARRADALDVQLVPAPRAPADEPRFFTEQPDDGTSSPPDRADFLSNVDAVVQDRMPGGADAMPASEGRADMPQVALIPGEDAVPPPLPGRPAEAPGEPEEAVEVPGAGLAAAPAGAAPTLAEALRAALGQDRPAPAGRTGNSDILQEAMDSATNAAGAGDIRLSTTAWDYAPWLQGFRRALLERWHPPQAFFLGLVEGWAVVEAEIARDGTLVRVAVLQEDVDHWSLTDAAVQALRRAAPYRPLPATFPEETLRVQVRFSYSGAKR